MCTQIYSYNQVFVQWSSSITSKGIKHVNLREKNIVRELHQDNSVGVTHIPGVINPSDISTKEMRDSAHFLCLHDSMIGPLEAFL